ncbi:MAG: hypothetical protein V4614_11280 [Pseudomonadota bacterium]
MRGLRNQKPRPAPAHRKPATPIDAEEVLRKAWNAVGKNVD